MTQGAAQGRVCAGPTGGELLGEGRVVVADVAWSATQLACAAITWEHGLSASRPCGAVVHPLVRVTGAVSALGLGHERRSARRCRV